MNYNNSNGQLTYQISIDKQQRNGFPIPCNVKGTGKLAVLYPTQALEVTYGTKIDDTAFAGVQFNPLAVPIMANMYVKQEHYYVPFNNVWQNWDNFISGGEELDFNTPPPSVSFQRIITMLNSLFGNGFGLSYKAINVTTPTNPWASAGLYLYVEIPSIPIQSKLGNLYTKMAMYGMSDLNKHLVLPAVENLVKLFDYYQDIITGIRRTSSDTILSGSKHLTPEIYYDSSNGGSFNLLIGAYTNSKIRLYDGTYIDVFPADYEDSQIYKNIEYSYNIYRSKFSTPITIDFRFTDLGYEFIQKLYKPYQPFVGVGSYMDYLRMGSLTDEHFVYLMYCSLVYAQQNESDFVIHPEILSDMQLRALELRSLYLIWYNNYRDQLLETSAMKPRRDDDITDDELLVILMPRVRCWEKDSYTTALDNPATADAVVPVGYHNAVRMYYQNVDADEALGTTNPDIRKSESNLYAIKFSSDNEVLRIPTNFLHGISKGNDVNGTNYNNGTYFSLHVLDAVKRAQRFLRKALFYGNRIQDFIYANFGVKHLDARLRLPELLSASSTTAELQTLVNNTTVVTDQSATVAGDRAGFAKGYDEGKSFDRYCEESGLIISYFSVIPEPTYAHGQSRQYSKLDRYDYPFPDFATLGMDAVYDNELTALPCKVAQGNDLVAYPLVFGYQGRYYDSKFRQSTEHGELLTTQDMYTFSRKFNMFNPTERPLLNAEFVHCFPPLDMFVMEDGTEDYFRFDVYHKAIVELQLPYHSVYL